MNERDGLATEDARRFAARRANPARNIGSRIRCIEGLELASKRHALLQLPKVRLFESRAQLGLSGQHEGQKLYRVRLDIREETYLFEQFDAEAVRLVDHERSRFPGCMSFAKQPLEMLEEERLGLTRLGAQIEPEAASG